MIVWLRFSAATKMELDIDLSSKVSSETDMP